MERREKYVVVRLKRTKTGPCLQRKEITNSTGEEGQEKEKQRVGKEKARISETPRERSPPDLPYRYKRNYDQNF